MSEPNREITLRFLAQPSDVNFGGKVHGGAVMKWIDQAGYVCATGWSGNYCVTVNVGEVNFHNPILIGNLVDACAKVILTGRTSIHISVDLRSCDPRKCELTQAIHCIIVFVAVDEHGKPVKVPSWQPVKAEDVAFKRYAQKLMKLKQEIRKELDE